MKMCLKLAYCAFSSSPSNDATMSTFCGFSSLFVEAETFWWVFPLQNLSPNLSLYGHPLNEDVSQAIIGTFYQCRFQKMVGWVALRFLLSLCCSLNRFKCDGRCLFLCYCDSDFGCEKSFLTGKESNVLGNVLIVDHHIKKMYIYISVWIW